MTDVLIYADTMRSPELRHEVPLAVPDPFLYAERDGERHVFIGSLEIPRMTELSGLSVSPVEELGIDELLSSGRPRREAELEVVVRACRRLGVTDAVAPATFPLEAADHLQANGVSVRADAEFFDQRRRSKTEPEIAGIRRALRASERALGAARAELRRSDDVTCESVRSRMLEVLAEAGMIVVHLPIVSHGPQTAIGHHEGSGPIAEGEPIVLDLAPQDPQSGCFADTTRTFCVGEPPAELTQYHRLCREALERVYPSIRPGVRGKELFELACDLFEEHGYPTQRTKPAGEVLEDGFFHALGHGVGLEVHESPGVGRSGHEELVPGDVLAIEPGLYRKGFGGCRLEDLVLVTEDGCQVLTDYPYDLEP